MSVESGGPEVLRRHQGIDLEAAMSAATKAARDAFAAAGMPDPGVVVNVQWRRGLTFYVAGGAVPRRPTDLLAESLRASADEVDEARS